MQEEPSKRAEEIFCAALSLPKEERKSYIREACLDDTGLQEEVQVLLEVHDEIPTEFLGAFDQTIAADGSNRRSGKALVQISDRGGEEYSEQEGDVIGPYKLLQPLGEGGFGVVWMAEQKEPIVRKVALKVIKAGMDTKEVLARFEAERQAIALMDHANIAKVLDAGSTDNGRPWFAMELVKGIPITQFCDQRGYTTNQRLYLFRNICSAIHHAHQKGVIHRDIKPTNILVTLNADQPVVKVIDFGIAKATQGKLTDKTVYTRFEQFIGTPIYMSPEQASLSGLDIDTRSDIYSLGIVLYELLAGAPPFDSRTLLSAGYDEMRRIILEEEPIRPSIKISTAGTEEERKNLSRNHGAEAAKLSRLVRDELDWVVMKAIEKERSRRYETANSFAADIDAYLSFQPVSAAPPSTSYRLKKFVRRNRKSLATWALSGAALIAGLTVAVIVAAENALSEERRLIAVEEKISGILAEAERQMDLNETADYENRLHFEQAATAMERLETIIQVESKLPNLSDRISTVSARIHQEADDRQLIDKIEDAVVLMASSPGEGGTAEESGMSRLASAMDESGLNPFTESHEVIMSRIDSRRQGTRERILLGFSAWAQGTHQDRERADTISAITRAVSSPSWLNTFLRALETDDAETLVQLSESDDFTARPPIMFAITYQEMLELRVGTEAEQMLRRIQLEHPGEFWCNLLLGFEHISLPFYDNAEGETRRRLAFHARLAGDPEGVFPLIDEHLPYADTSAEKIKLEKGIGYLRAAVAARPDSDSAHLSLGYSLMRMGYQAEAERYILNAIDLAKETDSALFVFSMLSTLLIQEQRFEEVVALCDRVEQQAIGDEPVFIARLQRFNALIQLREYEEAKATAKRMAASDMGGFNLKFGDQRADFEEGGGTAPDENGLEELLTVMAMQQITLGDQREAVVTLRQCIKSAPEFAPAYGQLGFALMSGKRKNPQEARRALQKAVELDPENEFYVGNLGTAYRELGQYAKAVELWTRAIELDPENALYLTNLGSYELSNDNYELADSYLQRSLESDRNMLTTWLNLLMLNEKTVGGHEERVTLLEGFAEALPDHHMPYLMAGDYFSTGEFKDTDRAIAAYKIALELKHDDEVILNALMSLFLGEKKYEEALRVAREAIESSPEFAHAHRQLIFVLASLGRWDEALDASLEWSKATSEDSENFRSLPFFFTGRLLGAELIHGGCVVSGCPLNHAEQNNEEVRRLVDMYGRGSAEVREKLDQIWSTLETFPICNQRFPELTESQLRGFYQENRELVSSLHGKVSFRLIRLGPFAKRELRESLLEKVRAGESFHELAKQYSLGAQAESGGLRTDISPGKMSGSLDRILFTSPVGMIDEVLLIDGEYFLIKILERSEGEVLPYEHTAVQNFLRVLRNEKLRETWRENYLTRLLDPNEDLVMGKLHRALAVSEAKSKNPEGVISHLEDAEKIYSQLKGEESSETSKIRRQIDDLKGMLKIQ